MFDALTDKQVDKVIAAIEKISADVKTTVQSAQRMQVMKLLATASNCSSGCGRMLVADGQKIIDWINGTDHVEPEKASVPLVGPIAAQEVSNG